MSALEKRESISEAALQGANRILDEMRRTEPNQSNQLYQQTFQLLRQGGMEAEIPRLVVFGQQSMGKTTLLDFIIGGPIGFSSTSTGTKMPVVISISPSKNSDASMAVKLEGHTVDLDELHNRMEKIMRDQGDIISSRELNLDIEMPGSAHAIFVDLPGIKDDSKDGAETTRAVVRNYVQNNPNDLYILVKKASDDPANWPWSLREFILTTPPGGLGLAKTQTIVVGTRALEFLSNERNELDSLEALKSRVDARSIHDSAGFLIPIHLLELFSLPLTMKKGDDGFLTRKKEMVNQIGSGHRRCNRLLKEFSTGSIDNSQAIQLAKVFDPSSFMEDLSDQFRRLLSRQLVGLTGRIETRIRSVQAEIKLVEKDLSVTAHLSIREAMRLFIRELLQVVTELVRGDYVIMRLKDSGEGFLKEFGGSLRDNLTDGEELATQLFPNKSQYDPEFLSNLQDWSKEVSRQRIESEHRRVLEESLLIASPQNEIDDTVQIVEPRPYPTPHLFPGQMVAMTLQKSKRSQLLGFVSLLGSSIDVADRSVEATFFHQGDQRSLSRVSSRPSSGQSQDTNLTLRSRVVEAIRLNVVVPLGVVVSKLVDMDGGADTLSGLQVYHRVIRADGWLGLENVSLLQLENIRMSSTTTATISPIIARKLRLQGDPISAVTGSAVVITSDGQRSSVAIEDIFVSSQLLRRSTGGRTHLAVYQLVHHEMHADVAIAGQLANTKLLNQLSLTYLGRWLKYHINRLEPDRKFSLNILMQMMRSVRHVIDKADWEPLVADLLQANVRGGLLCLSRLASCAAGVALRRIVRASLAEVSRKVEEGLLTPGLLFLVKSPKFMEEVSDGLETFCQERALNCAETMREMIFEQTHAVHFEMIEDFFEGCRDFEDQFLPPSPDSRGMEEVLERVQTTLHARKERLGTADIYSRQDVGNDYKHSTLANEELIYEEVRIQFWVVKQLLSAPLTTKLYMHFVKDIKDRSSHLASEGRNQNSSECDLEVFLQQKIMFDDNTMPREDASLMTHFGLDIQNQGLLNQLEQKKRLVSFLKVIKQGTNLLLTCIQRGNGVDFLNHLHKSVSLPTVDDDLHDVMGDFLQQENDDREEIEKQHPVELAESV
eukprot:GHVH01010657.1.p1 GENE.GHVH01010657.1~~GHVH01010657.1.p1  ORF type:complete len:1112 (+),score=193.40 GHVH01010657.1:194-3529(+)